MFFVGYSRTQKECKYWNPQNRRYVVSADVTFFKGTSFFSSTDDVLDVDVLVLSSSIPLPIPPSCSSQPL